MTGEIYTVKNMVCHRCILAVETILNETGIPFQFVTAGEIHFNHTVTDEECTKLKTALAHIGLELVDRGTSGIIEKIKVLVIKKARNEVAEADTNKKLSGFLSEQLHHEYTYLSSLFSSIEGRTIENYFIEQRIEKVKELLVYNESSLSQIAFDLDYSSVAYLSNQFKKITGLTPSHFKTLGSAKRKLLDKV